MVQAAILGYGTVGSGIAEVLTRNSDVIAKRAGQEINLKYILDLREFPGDPNEKKVVHDFDIILNDPEVKVICETMGGNEPAFTFSKKALAAGKSVCTSNKELVANHGAELIKLAKDNKCNYLFEASVGGGIPIIRPINYSLTPEKIVEISGILNGTTNYILTKMDKENADFDSTLKKAQELGYAEKNPEADIEGYDACRKIAILSSLISGKNVRYTEIPTEGITAVTADDFKYAHFMKRRIKLLAMSEQNEDGIYAMVAPFMISEENPLYMVNDVFNAIFVHGNTLGDSMYYGRGAGKLPTASAVVSDVIDCARHLGVCTSCLWDQEEAAILSMDKVEHSFFVRVSAADRAAAEKLFAGHKEIKAQVDGEYAFVTDKMSEKDFAEAAEKIRMISRIRMGA
mgnify:CR=1 FL=1